MSGKIECDTYGVDVEAVHVEILLPKSPTPVAIPINCRLGLDKKSGRVKWCPDCQFIKYFLILPVILLPVIVVFVLMMRISSTFTGRIELTPATERIQMPIDLEPVHRITRDVNKLMATINQNCEIFRHLTPEKSIADIHLQQDLFRDIRTSFIPSEMCLRLYREMSHDEIDSEINSVDDPPQTNQSKSVDQLRRWINKYADPIDFNRLNYGSLNFRRRRRHINIDDDIIDDGQNKTNDIENGSNEAAEKMTTLMPELAKETVDDEPLEIPAFLRTFWKGGKTYEQIRNSQVEIIKQYMDASVAPCDDFYQYACGNWEKLNPIPKDKAAYDTFEMLREILDIELNSLLSESKVSVESKRNHDIDDASMMTNTTEIPSTEITDTSNSIENNNVKRSDRNAERITMSAEQKAKFLYKSCMNAEILEQRKLEPLYALLDSLGGWPVLHGDKWNASKFNWLELAAKLRLYNNVIASLRYFSLFNVLLL